MDYLTLPSSFSFASMGQICVITHWVFLCGFLGWKIPRPFRQCKFKPKPTQSFLYFPPRKAQVKKGKYPYHLQVPIVDLFFFYGGYSPYWSWLYARIAVLTTSLALKASWVSCICVGFHRSYSRPEISPQVC